MDWGTFPDWIAGLSGFLAFVAATIAVVFAVRSFRQQAAQVKMLEQQSRASQASKIAAWLEKEGPDSDVTLRVRNSSNLPAYMGITFLIDASTHSAGHRRQSSYVKPDDLAVDPGRRVAPNHQVGLAFIDASGIAWLRWGPLPLLEVKLETIKHLRETVPESEFVKYDFDAILNKYALSADPSLMTRLDLKDRK